MKKHYHEAQYVDGKLVDECRVCNESWRNTDVHISESAQHKLTGANSND